MCIYVLCVCTYIYISSTSVKKIPGTVTVLLDLKEVNMGGEVRKGVVWESTGINLSVDTLALGPSASHLVTSSLSTLQGWC